MDSAVIHTPKELAAYAEQIVHTLAEQGIEGAHVLALTGDLGAGKTALTKAVAETLGISDVVQSPTFVIEKKYPIPEGKPFKNLIHVDAYRLESEEELGTLDFAECIEESGNLIIVEWAERIEEQLPGETVWLSLELLPDGSRRITSQKKHEHKK